MQGEFRMITDLATVAPKELLFNYDELKAFLTEALRDYKALVVTEDAISDAKQKRAKLNKLAENINAYRINVKKQLMAQYDEDFKPKCDELVAMTKEASDSISNQIKAFESAEADAKIAGIKEYYFAEGSAEVREYCPWERIYSDKWRNKGFSADMAKGSIDGAFEVVEHDLAAVRDMGGDDTPYLLDVYKQTHDLSEVIRKASELRTAREREEQRKREAEEAQKPFMEAVAVAAAERVAKIVRSGGNAPVEAEEPLVTVDFRVTCTKVQLNELGQWMKRNGIKYGRCK